MHDENANPNSNAHGEGYETADIRIKVAVYAFVGTFALLGISVFLMVLMLRSWEAGVMDRTPLSVFPSQRATAASQLLEQPAWETEIRLQAKPEADYKAHLLEQNHKAALYSWVDKETGVARIPLEEAMQRALANGLPSWPELSPEAVAAQAEAAAAVAAPPAPEQPAPAAEQPAPVTP